MESVDEPAQDDGAEAIGDRDRIPAPCAREPIARRRLRDVIAENKWVGHRLAAYRRFDHRYMDRQAYTVQDGGRNPGLPPALKSGTTSKRLKA